MFEIKNLRKEMGGGACYLKCDFNVTGMKSPFEENTMWIAVDEKNEDMLADNVYDPFVLVPTIMGMYYGQDVKIDGNISPRLYHNLQHYMLNIFNRFSDKTKMVKVEVTGFDTVKQIDNPLIGTGISCGVDSLVTIYDNFVMENDPNFKLSSLFFFNCGTHGDFENPESQKRFKDRANLNKRAADALGLPMYTVSSNLHAFTHKWGEQVIGYLAIYSCALSMQKYVRRYLTSSNLSYDEIMVNRENSRDFDFAEYCESFYPHLVSTENFELVIDGCQYTRAEKTERIADWEIAQKYLNVCLQPINDGHNCSCCEKCMWTLIPLEAMGKLDNFKEVFDIETYKKNSKEWKTKFVARTGKDSMETSVMGYAKSKGMKVPSVPVAKAEWFEKRAVRKIKKIAGKNK